MIPIRQKEPFRRNVGSLDPPRPSDDLQALQLSLLGGVLIWVYSGRFRGGAVLGSCSIYVFKRLFAVYACLRARLGGGPIAVLHIRQQRSLARLLQKHISPPLSLCEEEIGVSTMYVCVRVCECM
jgi:hypothetical protein